MQNIDKDAQVGLELTGKLKTITDERVFAFSGGFPKGPDWPKKTIHTNLEFARASGLPKRTASGAMFEGYITELMINTFGEQWLRGGKMTLKFIAIVTPGDKLLPKAIIRSRQAENSGVRFALDVWCEKQGGEKVVIGTATGLVPNL